MNRPVPSPGLRSGTRLRVTGRPTREQLTAAVVAIDQATAADRATTGAPARPAWLRAARAEGVGGGRVATPTDLRARR
ncbi:MAG: hypothetical protein M3N52_04160 [Actinomycetota bacterium]|nr:hypothetical protein [Actinomycetota bacterium]